LQPAVQPSVQPGASKDPAGNYHSLDNSKTYWQAQ
jgi:hypothetical protein